MLVESIKFSLRITESDFDDEINSLIEMCKSDLETSGVAPSFFEENKEIKLYNLYQSAVINYCKAEFGYDNSESERFRKSYEILKTKMVIMSNGLESD